MPAFFLTFSPEKLTDALGLARFRADPARELRRLAKGVHTDEAAALAYAAAEGPAVVICPDGRTIRPASASDEAAGGACA